MSRPEITGVPGVAETAVSEVLLARLPENLHPAPWDAIASSIVWYSRGGKAAGNALSERLRGARGLAVVGGLVRYEYTPVGTYDEVFGAVGHRHGKGVVGTVPFMAVDSEPSLVGGRTNWSLPKCLAAFDGDPQSGKTFTARGADAANWRVSATPRVIGPAISMKRESTLVQEFHDGSVRPMALTMKSKMRPALVTVEVESDGDLPTWLKPGRHLGAVVERMEFSLDVPVAP